MLARLRWFTSGLLLAAIGITGGSLWLQVDRRAESMRAEHEALRRRAEQLERERQELTEIVERLNVERRVAQIEVLEQHADPSGRVLQSVIRMTEIGRNGEALPPQVFGIPGRVPYFDALVIKFDNEYVSRGDALRGRSLALFRRIYGETQAPESGFWLGRPGEVPDIYRVSPEPSEFEINLWREFWSYATDPAQARQAGVRVAQGEAVYAPMSAEEHWILTLEADGGLNLIKQEGPPSDPNASASPGSVTAASPTPAPDRRLYTPSPLPEGPSGR